MSPLKTLSSLALGLAFAFGAQAHSLKPVGSVEGISEYRFDNGLALVLFPSWPLDWLAAAAGSPYHLAPIQRPGGFLLLLGLLRWRAPEGRLRSPSNASSGRDRCCGGAPRPGRRRRARRRRRRP